MTKKEFIKQLFKDLKNKYPELKPGMSQSYEDLIYGLGFYIDVTKKKNQGPSNIFTGTTTVSYYIHIYLRLQPSVAFQNLYGFSPNSIKNRYGIVDKYEKAVKKVFAKSGNWFIQLDNTYNFSKVADVIDEIVDGLPETYKEYRKTLNQEKAQRDMEAQDWRNAGYATTVTDTCFFIKTNLTGDFALKATIDKANSQLIKLAIETGKAQWYTRNQGSGIVVDTKFFNEFEALLQKYTK